MQGRYGPFISFALILTTLAICLVILRWMPAGAVVPIHFSHGWVPDRFVSPLKGVMLWAGLQFGLWMVMYGAPRIMPGKGFQASVSVYDAAWITLTATLGAFAIACMEYALGVKITIGSLADVMTGMFLIVVGNGLGKVRPNALVGIRTPWTRASVRVWDRTHRACGPVFILAGMALVASGFGMLPIRAGTHFRHYVS